jgi:hypothetical protein
VDFYDEAVEQAMKAFYDSLSERDKRRYAAVEAKKLDHGGTEYISRLLGVDGKTIRRGHIDLVSPEAMNQKRTRKKGAGRKAS